ncbi:MAG: hypothetical protein AAF039_16505 [Bacteroidota bacterium]
MKYAFGLLLSVLLLAACTPLKNLQTVATRIPCIGSVGAIKNGVFSKEFQKVGEPQISESIAVALQSHAFTNVTYRAYQKYRENLGKPPSVAYHDSLEVAPRFFQLEVADRVRLKSLLNAKSNTSLLHYLEEDSNIQMLTGISFVTMGPQHQSLEEAQHISLTQKEGHLILQVENSIGNLEIDMKSLEVFDFETSGFCWQTNQRNQPAIAVLIGTGESCPRGTEKSANKLDETRQYLKL